MNDSNSNKRADDEPEGSADQIEGATGAPAQPAFPDPPRAEFTRPVEKHGKAERANRGVQSTGMGLALAYSGLTPAISALIGYPLDQLLGTAPWLVIIFLILGSVAGFLQLIRGLDRLDRSEKH